MAGPLIDLPLATRTIVVTRAAEQAGTFADRLRAVGAGVVEVALTRTADPADGGAALDAAVGRLDEFDWVVVTSPNGARRFATALSRPGDGRRPRRLAVVGPGTAQASSEVGLVADLVPSRAVAEGLLAAFPVPPADGSGRVLVAQAAAARPVLVDGLRALGWEVNAVQAYRTVPVVADPSVADEIRAADALTFLAGSAVSSFVRSFPSQGNWPPIVVIGPVTLAAARAAGLTVTAMADPHTLDAMVDALVSLLAD